MSSAIWFSTSSTRLNDRRSTPCTTGVSHLDASDLTAPKKCAFDPGCAPYLVIKGLVSVITQGGPERIPRWRRRAGNLITADAQRDQAANAARSSEGRGLRLLPPSASHRKLPAAIHRLVTGRNSRRRPFVSRPPSGPISIGPVLVAEMEPIASLGRAATPAALNSGFFAEPPDYPRDEGVGRKGFAPGVRRLSSL